METSCLISLLSFTIYTLLAAAGIYAIIQATQYHNYSALIIVGIVFLAYFVIEDSNIFRREITKALRRKEEKDKQRHQNQIKKAEAAQRLYNYKQAVAAETAMKQREKAEQSNT